MTTATKMEPESIRLLLMVTFILEKYDHFVMDLLSTFTQNQRVIEDNVYFQCQICIQCECMKQRTHTNTHAYFKIQLSLSKLFCGGIIQFGGDT